MERETGRKMDLAFDVLLKLVKESPVLPFPMDKVVDEFALIEAVVMDPSQLCIETGLRSFKSLAIRARAIIFSFDHGKDFESFARQLRSTLFHGLYMRFDIARIRRDAKTFPKPSRIHYPRTGQLSFVEHLAENLQELVKHKADKIGPLKYYILQLQGKLQSMSSRLMALPEARKQEVYANDLITSIANMAYEAEYAIDSLVVKDIPLWCCLCWVNDILQELDPDERQLQMDSGDVQSMINSVINSDKKYLDIIPIYSDKDISENLRMVFTDPAISRKFRIRTWTLVSSYRERKKEVFRELLGNALHHSVLLDREKRLIKEAYTSEGSVDELLISFYRDITDYNLEDEIEVNVYRLLDDYKFFIILEDVQDLDALNDIIYRVLPQGMKSRVLFTTSSAELAALGRHGFRRYLFNEKSEDRTSTSQFHKLKIDDDVVGFKEETEWMLTRLVDGPKQLRIISIAGMPGQGKTTFARKIFHDHSVVNYFHIRAWCYVSQVYEKKKLLLEILGQVIQLSDTIRQKSDLELAELLCKSLRGNKFLVVLDDMWSTQAWNDVARCFPEHNNGSRIIFTTRLQHLASQVKSSSMLLSLGVLSDGESWELLKRTVFQKENYPLELLEVGTRIAKNCKGLPLAIVLIAGLLEKMEKTEYQWIQIAESLSRVVLDNAEAQNKEIIELSYKHLPNHLKPCLLYLGAFLEDKEIPVWKLIRYWIAEGFIKYTGFKSLEDVAEDYLMDLIGRSLVTVAQNKSQGGVRSCRIHDILRDFCLSKAVEENFWQIIRGYQKHFHDVVNLRRLCIYSESNYFMILKPYGPHVRSLLFFATSDMGPSDSYDISFISQNFKLLKILDLENINIGDSFKAIGMLVLLRYLAVQCDMDFIPSSIADLWNLETFLVKSLRANVLKVPNFIWSMKKLRHVHINEGASFHFDLHIFESSSILDNLQTFSTPSFAYGDNMEKMMRKLTSIRKLKCIFLDSWDDARSRNQFPLLGSLNKLDSLKVLYNGDGKYPCQFDFPSNLKKLTLSNFRLPWTEISQLATLGNLEVLKLLDHAFEDETWEMEEEIFPKLKSLKLDTLNIVNWSACDENFPCLEHLLLHNCKQLEKIPSDIGDIPSLQKIEVVWCSPSLATSATKIQDEQLEYAKEINVHIHPMAWDSESSS